VSRVATLAAGALAAAGAAVAHRVLTGQVRAPRWQRTNHAGNPVTLLEGPAYVAGAALGAATSGPAGVVAVLGAGAFGALDDLAGDGASKGLKGHLGAAAGGRVTTGLVKVAGIGATGLVAAALADRGRDDVAALDTLVGGAVVAGAANLANLLDLRPGRALKVTVLAALPLLLSDGGPAAPRAAAAAGAALGVLRPDLAGSAMLGDTGANAAGALIGTALLGATGRRGRVVALVVLTGLTLASERVSFTQVIESTPVLRELDAWGWPAR
jgi:UDP-N-acetylmuramyl pentapeptide phosphotransferase/UDP-N-acetylglucosamine-1-phosphate transferase